MISNPNKVIFADPEITKGDVIRYYAQVAERMLPYLSRRILSIVRCPKGISQTCFYKKHPGPGSKGIVTIPISTSDGELEDYFYIENTSGLIAEAQMGTLEFHTWGSRVGELVFDLDPDEGMDLSRVRQGVGCEKYSRRAFPELVPQDQRRQRVPCGRPFKTCR